ncbi:MAG: NAD(P)H-hydrate dehydratase [Candidatus Delongbacteria bacterium]|nr:NAD(P)H-hydrate dehydratase [Candidatus Delongbacteria bacterium]MBN2836569.1 NAD(P)H-hydrate dehydratase [Candidatus Delongbacteria bacterium]
MLRLFTAEEMRSIDEKAIEQGMKHADLMNNAADRVFEKVTELEPELKDKKILVVCGPGNNGGDAMLVAGKLDDAGYDVRMVVLSKKTLLKGEPKKISTKVSKSIKDNSFISEYSETIMHGVDIIIDGIFGTGFNSNPEGVFYDMIEAMNNSGKRIYSIDIPSGIHGSTGFMEDIAVIATTTISLQFPKLGLFINDGYVHSGEVINVDIGIPEGLDSEIEEKRYITDLSDLKGKLKKRDLMVDKKDFGKVFNFAGSLATPGAAILSSMAALRCGTGLLKLGVPMNISAAIASVNPEIMTVPLPYNQPGYTSMNAEKDILKAYSWCDAVLAGPGLSVSMETKKVTKRLISRNIDRPMVLDADALNVLSEGPDFIDRLGDQVVITPHNSEMARLAGTSKEFLLLDRINTCIQKAKDLDCYVVLKGTPTIVSSPKGEIFIHVNKNPGMAVGGSGDLLAGILVSFLGQKIAVPDAILLALYVHKIAGDLATEKYGENSVLPTDMLKEIPHAIKQIINL